MCHSEPLVSRLSTSRSEIDRVHHRVPVDQPLVAVDQPFAVQLHEDPAHRRRQARIHREALARPIGRSAEPPQLAGDRAARLLLPLPDPLDELLAAEIVLVDLPLGELVGDDDLGGDAGVVGAGLPQRVAAAHALEADQDVLQREGQRVPHMQAAGDVRRRHHDRVGRACCCAGSAAKAPARFPGRVLPRLHGIGPISLVQHRLQSVRIGDRWSTAGRNATSNRHARRGGRARRR